MPVGAVMRLPTMVWLLPNAQIPLPAEPEIIRFPEITTLVAGVESTMTTARMAFVEGLMMTNPTSDVSVPHHKPILTPLRLHLPFSIAYFVSLPPLKPLQP